MLASNHKNLWVAESGTYASIEGSRIMRDEMGNDKIQKNPIDIEYRKKPTKTTFQTINKSTQLSYECNLFSDGSVLVKTMRRWSCVCVRHYKDTKSAMFDSPEFDPEKTAFQKAIIKLSIYRHQ